MPIVQVTPATSDLLQDVANALGKARKVVVVTGAGISTNSGIPDFRSENGLYSLIQAQFESAAASRSQEPIEDELNGFDISDRPTKRRRVSMDPDPSVADSTDQEHSSHTYPDKVNDKSPSYKDAPEHGAGNFRLRIDGNDALKQDVESSHSRPQLPGIRPPFPRHLTQCSVRSSTSQDSVFSGPQSSTTSTQTEDSANSSTPCLQDHPTASSTPKSLLLGEAVISSPLSSPPPVLFDPYENIARSTQESSRLSSECSDSSDTEDTQQSLDFLSSQTSNSSLRNMKGRDLFDSNIWADPLKTSVFYRFATSLRQKVKEVQPTTTHHFIAQLRDVGKLARVYTQNIDEIEKKIGLSTDLRSGAGNKRRKSAKQQQLLAEPEKDAKENMDQLKDEDYPITNGKVDANQPTAQTSEDAERAKSRPSLMPDKGVECVFLHGSLHSLRCFVCGKLCDWDEDREFRTLSGEQPECPHCAGATAAREEKGKRALGVGKLRPDIVLYGEEHPQSDLISPIVQYDLSAGPDLLLVLGTSLRVHGLKVMVKEFAKAVHNKGGKVVFINFTKPSESVWGDIIDYWIEWDCDAWVTDLKDRKPYLWLSPEEIQEQEKQRRETLAERRRGNLLKRESLLGEKRRQTIETSKPRAPPKNPSAMRNDYASGAYVVYDIFQTLAKIGNRPFDNLGYTPPPTTMPEPPPPRPEQVPSPVVGIEQAKLAKEAKAAKVKRPRKSAPAMLSSRASSQSDRRPAIKARYWFSAASELIVQGAGFAENKIERRKAKPRNKKATSESKKTDSESKKVNPAPRFIPISQTPIPPPVIPQLLLRPRPSPPPPPPAPASVSAPTSAPAAQEEQGYTTLSQDSLTSIGAAVKTHPRRRKRKEIFEGPIVRPAPKPRRAVPKSTPIPLPIPAPSNADTPPASRALVDSSYLSPQEAITLAPIRPGPEISTPTIKCLEPTPIVSPTSPLAYPARPQSYQFPYPSHPMLFSDPLVRLPYGADIRRGLRGPKLVERRPVAKDSTPSPSDQLRREHWEAAASLMSLGVATQEQVGV